MASFSAVRNLESELAQVNLQSTALGLNKAMTRLSSGLYINSSGDDAAGLAVANYYRQEIAIMNQGVRNANDGLSDLQIKDGALANISTLLDRLATLATQAATSTTTDASRATLQQEFTDVLAEITREANVAGLASSTSFSVFMSNDGEHGVVNGTIGAVTTSALGLEGLSLTAQAAAQTAVQAISSAVSALGSVQGTIGALENRLQFAISLAKSQIVNTTGAESRIRDANMAQEAANLSRYSVLQQAGIASLAQANNNGSAVLALLRG